MKWDPCITSVNNLKIAGFIPHADIMADGILFSVVVPEGEQASLLLYEKGSDQVKMEVPFPDSPVTGRVFAMMVSGIPAESMEYNYRIGGRIVTDPSAQIVSGREKFGEPRGKGEHCVRGGFACQQFDWGDEDKHLRIPFSESVFYELHVRGFTKSPSSKVRNRGTFAGIIEKIPYLKGLGITAVMLMPCYEFDEVIDRDRDAYRPEGLGRLIAGSSLPESAVMMPEGELRPEMRAENSPQGSDAKGAGKSGKTSGHLNYWGFGPGWFFAPKRSYSASADPSVEFRTMVRELHRAGIEVLMEINWPEGTDPAYMQACLLWWTEFYHVDGFLMMSSQDDMNAVAKSPALSDVKLISDYFDTARMYPKGRPYRFRNLAEYNVGFRYDARKFLKGDSDSLKDFVSRCRYNPKDAGVINAITGHDGFTLLDLVSYNDKHNEENGENNRDGAAYEYSWNCGVEGPSRKKEISRLRMKQMKNALALMMLSQGTPMLTAGDEMLNTQMGNSNPYCFDSELTWIRWSDTKDAQELSEYVRMLIAFRASHPLLHQKAELTGASLGGFFPDFSCHGSNAWFASFDQQERSVGMMYCAQEPDGDVLKELKNSKEGSYVYVAYNFHWQERELALPYLPSGREWHVMIDTSVDRFSRQPGGKDCGCGSSEEVKCVRVPARTIRVLVG